MVIKLSYSKVRLKKFIPKYAKGSNIFELFLYLDAFRPDYRRMLVNNNQEQ
jgi:hypothetical protein